MPARTHKAQPDTPVRDALRAETTSGEKDANLVVRALAGDPWAEEALYRRHAPSVTRLCMRVLKRAADVDDAVQDTFVIAFTKLASLRDPEALRAWLMRIALQRSRRLLRKRTLLGPWRMDPHVDLAALGADERGPMSPDRRLELKAIDQALATEARERRVAWWLHRVEGLNLRETTLATDRSLATIKRYISAVDAHIARALGGPDA